MRPFTTADGHLTFILTPERERIQKIEIASFCVFRVRPSQKLTTPRVLVAPEPIGRFLTIRHHVVRAVFVSVGHLLRIRICSQECAGQEPKQYCTHQTAPLT
jgi:hypothetical protein